MAGVIVQSKATSHVYRIFSALIVLLLLMAFAIGMSRLRSDQQGGSPYGTLAALAPAPQDPVPVAAVTAAVYPKPAPPVAAAPAPSSPAQTAIAGATSAQAAMAAATPNLPPANMMALADPGTGPRRIALDKAAAVSPIPQPAPPAVVQAATKAAAAPSPATVSAPPVVAPRSVATPPAPPRKVAAVEDAPVAPDQRQTASGLVNINRASVDEMNRLGAGRIGSTIARHRPYRSIEDLVSRRILKARDLARIEAGITAN